METVIGANIEIPREVASGIGEPRAMLLEIDSKSTPATVTDGGLPVLVARDCSAVLRSVASLERSRWRRFFFGTERAAPKLVTTVYYPYFFR